MIQREITPILRSLFGKYPVVTVTGPRQSGKTTLCRATFPDLQYVNLERPDTRNFAQEDPLGFLSRLENGAIIDEIQRVPDLVSYIQVQVDEQGRNGIFVLTGSRQFEVSEAISQSLAGRTGLLRLLPFTIAEVNRFRPEMDIDSMIYGGFYPRIYDQDIDPIQAYGDYFETYVERDVRQIGEIRQLKEFQRFVQLCAGRTGQLLNLQSLGNDAGISHTTARRWISILEASYILFCLQPFHANINKRLIKAPKMYFYDVGLAAYLMGIENSSQIRSHPLRGHLFENLVVVEALKYRFNRGKRSNLLFFRDSSGLEVDLLCARGARFAAIEVKAGQTVGRSFFSNLKKLRKLLPGRVAEEILVHGGQSEYVREGVKVTGPAGLAPLLGEWEDAGMVDA